VRILALLATHNEQRFIVACLEHFIRHGVDVYLIDNESDDETVPLASAFLGRGVAGIETMPRGDQYPWKRILERKAVLSGELDADWFMHADPDEIRLPPVPDQTLADAIARADAAGFNAVNFFEYTFVPTRQAPDHDHADYLRTMRWYYPFSPAFPNQLKAWKKQPVAVDLVSSAGHRVHFPDLKMYPTPFPMRHYLFLSVEHAVRKYVRRTWDPTELALGWHRSRSRLRAPDIVLQDESTLRVYAGDAALDASNPLTAHPLFAQGLAGDQNR
jgi:hypothetical protein